MSTRHHIGHFREDFLLATVHNLTNSVEAVKDKMVG